MLRAERLSTPAPAPEPPPPGPPPLTHHEIMRLAEPFSRAGRSVDLPASDRAARRLQFRPRELPAVADALPPLLETLQLQAGHAADPRAGVLLHRLQRQLLPRVAAVPPAASLAGPLCAVLEAEGPQVPELLAWLDAVTPAQQWLLAGGVPVALGHKLMTPARGQTEPVLLLASARAQLAGLAVELQVSRVKNVPAEITLHPLPGAHPAPPQTLPEDLLAVLGLAWSRLVRSSSGWRATVQLRGEGAARAQDAQAKFCRTVEHLAQVLAQAPAQFHARFAAARWRVSLRRGFPLLVCSGLIGAAAAVPLLELGPDSVWRMLIFNAPPLLLLWMFTLRELPRIEIPPLPRRLPASAWTPAPAAHER